MKDLNYFFFKIIYIRADFRVKKKDQFIKRKGKRKTMY